MQSKGQLGSWKILPHQKIYQKHTVVFYKWSGPQDRNQNDTNEAKKGEAKWKLNKVVQGDICSAGTENTPVLSPIELCIAVWKKKQWKPRSNKNQTCVSSVEGLEGVGVCVQWVSLWLDAFNFASSNWSHPIEATWLQQSALCFHWFYWYISHISKSASWGMVWCLLSAHIKRCFAGL